MRAVQGPLLRASPVAAEQSPAVEPAAFAPAAVGINAGLRREVFLNIPGAALADLTNHARFPAQPDLVDTLATFETPSNAADDYGVVRAVTGARHQRRH